MRSIEKRIGRAAGIDGEGRRVKSCVAEMLNIKQRKRTDRGHQMGAVDDCEAFFGFERERFELGVGKRASRLRRLCR